jgi:hypothetical protein
MEILPLSVLFHDVQRVSQNDIEHPIVSIAYSPDFIEAMDYFRAVLERDELSERSLELTRRIIALNPANYTVSFKKPYHIYIYIYVYIPLTFKPILQQ